MDINIENLIQQANQLSSDLYYQLLIGNIKKTQYHIVYYIIHEDDTETTIVLKKEIYKYHTDIFCMCLVYSYNIPNYIYEDTNISFYIQQPLHIQSRVSELYNYIQNITILTSDYFLENKIDYMNIELCKQLIHKYNCILYNDPNFDFNNDMGEKYDDFCACW